MTYAVAGGLIGLSMSAKYLAPFLLPFAVLVWLTSFLAAGGEDRRRVRIWHLVVGAGAAGFAFFLTHPFFFFNLQSAIAEIREQAAWVYSGEGTGYAGYAHRILSNLGYLGSAMAVVGLFSVLSRRRRDELLFLVPVATYLLVVGRGGGLVAPRYLMPVIPLLACIAGHGIATTCERLGRPRTRLLLKVGLILTVAIQPLLLSLAGVVPKLRTDTRTLAKEWVEHNLPPGAPIFIEEYGPQIRPVKQVALEIAEEGLDLLDDPSDHGRRRKRNRMWIKYADSRFYKQPQRAFIIYRRTAWSGENYPDYRSDTPPDYYWTLDQLQELGIRYYIATSEMFERYGGVEGRRLGTLGDQHSHTDHRPPTTREELRRFYPAGIPRSRFYRQLERRATVIKEIRPFLGDRAALPIQWRSCNILLDIAYKRPGPIIKIFALPVD